MISKRLELFIEFTRAFVKHTLQVREVIVSLILLIILGGVAISQIEGIKLIDAIYFAFVTGMSIGYGDISPQTTIGKITSVGIGLIGMLFVGLTVAIAVRALEQTSKRHLETKS